MDIKELGINLNIDSPSINFNQLREQLPYEDIRGYIVNKNGDKQSLIEYMKEYYRGGYGKLFLVKRTTSRSEFCLVKIPIYKESDLLKEAILQFMSYKILETLKLEYMLAKIYDIYTKNSIVHFSMELKNGIFFKEFIKSSKNPGNFSKCGAIRVISSLVNSFMKGYFR